MSEPYTFSQCGDIAFVRQSDWLSKSVVIGQRILGRRGARFSHVLLCVANQIWVHSTPETGVVVCSEAKYFDKERFDEILVVRPSTQELKRDGLGHFEHALAWVRIETATIEQWLASFFYFNAQRYDFFVGFLPFSAGRARYCSELVHKVYNQCLPDALSNGNKKRIFPHDLLQLTSKAKFDDITQIFLTGRDMEAKFSPRSPTVEEVIDLYLVAANRKLEATLAQIEAVERRIRIEMIIAQTPGQNFERT